mgnify:CR=1 FL=1
MIYTTEYNSPVGRIMIAAKDEALTGLWIENQKYYPASVKEEMKQCDDLAVSYRPKTGWTVTLPEKNRRSGN